MFDVECWVFNDLGAGVGVALGKWCLSGRIGGHSTTDLEGFNPDSCLLVSIRGQNR
jgi:hypothetical protein